MGQKTHPYIFRVGTIRTWQASWFADKKQYAKYLHEDISIREFFAKKFPMGTIASVQIERTSNGIVAIVQSAKPGMIVGRTGTGVADLQRELSVVLQTRKVEIKVKEIKKPDLDAQTVADNIASAIVRRISYRRAAKQAVQKAIEQGAKGAKVYVGGRLNGAEIARGEFVSEGRIPLQTLRADIDYATSAAITTYGKLGIKVWIYKGDIFDN